MILLSVPIQIGSFDQIIVRKILYAWKGSIDDEIKFGIDMRDKKSMH